ncbi:hypothetical protein DAEQUDRAFT_394500 [Daedalea quercina L-15889]|uniref:Uncharacterized protein n=1 Tax=Daedalea quercina L-15889 TaxID=1314783 RepID=A0A165NX11_9APHY|nr:hypothetical protein DAEQUDRAFT_394500 [Daedalea quercina L-15889]
MTRLTTLPPSFRVASEPRKDTCICRGPRNRCHVWHGEQMAERRLHGDGRHNIYVGKDGLLVVRTAEGATQWPMCGSWMPTAFEVAEVDTMRRAVDPMVYYHVRTHHSWHNLIGIDETLREDDASAYSEGGQTAGRSVRCVWQVEMVPRCGRVRLAAHK